MTGLQRFTHNGESLPGQKIILFLPSIMHWHTTWLRHDLNHRHRGRVYTDKTSVGKNVVDLYTKVPYMIKSQSNNPTDFLFSTTPRTYARYTPPPSLSPRPPGLIPGKHTLFSATPGLMSGKHALFSATPGLIPGNPPLFPPPPGL